jgi:hypothetical protein
MARPAVKFCYGQRVGVKTMTHEAETFNSREASCQPTEICFYNFVAARGGKLSLEDFIEFWGFPNEEAILQLCSRQMDPSSTAPVTTSEKDDRNTDRRPTENNPQSKVQQHDQEHPPCPEPDSELPLEIPAEPAVPKRLPALDHKIQTQTWSRTLLRSRVADVTLGK